MRSSKVVYKTTREILIDNVNEKTCHIFGASKGNIVILFSTYNIIRHRQCFFWSCVAGSIERNAHDTIRDAIEYYMGVYHGEVFTNNNQVAFAEDLCKLLKTRILV